MQALTEGNIVLAKLEDGEKVMPRILDIIEDQEIFSGVVLSGIGMLRDVTLNYFDGKRYLEKQYPRPMELISLSGSIATDSSIHVHASLADKDTRVVGGHLSMGTVHNLMELTILKLEEVQIGRKKNPVTGNPQYSLEPRRSVTVTEYEDDDE